MSVILVLLGLLAAGAGLLFLSEATTGVGLIAIGCFLGILARISQADAHHKELKQLLAGAKAQSQPVASAELSSEKPAV